MPIEVDLGHERREKVATENKIHCKFRIYDGDEHEMIESTHIFLRYSFQKTLKMKSKQ